MRDVTRRDGRAPFTALLHHIDVPLLRESYERFTRGAAPGVDEVRWSDYQEGLLENLTDLYERIHTGLTFSVSMGKSIFFKDAICARYILHRRYYHTTGLSTNTFYPLPRKPSCRLLTLLSGWHIRYHSLAGLLQRALRIVCNVVPVW